MDEPICQHLLGKALKRTARLIDKQATAAEASISQAKAGNMFDAYVATQLMGGMLCKGSQFKQQQLVGGGNLYANRLIQNSLAKMKFVPKNLPIVPAVVIRGKCDFHSLANAEKYRDAFDLNLVEIPSSGHGLLENRNRVNEVLRHFAQTRLAAID